MLMPGGGLGVMTGQDWRRGSGELESIPSASITEKGRNSKRGSESLVLLERKEEGPGPLGLEPGL